MSAKIPLAMVVQASREAITSVVDALAVDLDVGRVFQGVPAGQGYALRTIVCYFGHHYQVPCSSKMPSLSLVQPMSLHDIKGC